jgi:hypothetical protein
MSEWGWSELKDDQKFGLAVPSVESFHRALQAALHSRVALDLGRVVTPRPDHESTVPNGANRSRSLLKIPSGRLTFRKLHALQIAAEATPSDHFSSDRQLSDRRGQPVDPIELLTAAFGELAADLPQKYVNGFSVYIITGRTDLVLDAMSVDIRAEHELSRVARPSLAYLAVLVLTGTLGSGILGLMLLAVDDLREDLLLVPNPLAMSSNVIPWITESQFFMLPWIALLALLIASASLLTPVSVGIAKCFGGFGYRISQRRAMAARVEHALVLSGIDGAEAEQTAIRLVGFQPTRKRSVRAVSRSDQSPSDLQRSKLEAKHYLVRSNTRLRQLRLGLPLLFVLVVGSGGVLLYSLVLFVPLTNLLYDLAAPVVDPAMRWDQR